MSGAMEEAIRSSTGRIMGEVESARARAHAKHGENSIEAVPAGDPRWLPILVEEVGELAHEMTYDAGAPTERVAEYLERMRAEAMDVATVAVALVAAIDRELSGP